MAVEQEIAERFDNVIDKGQKLLTHSSARSSNRVDGELCLEWQSQGLTLLQTVFGPDHTFARNFETSTAHQGIVQSLASAVSRGQGVLKAAQEDFTRGWTWSFREMLHAEIFDDFLEMADHLLKNGSYFVADVVLAGSTLEEHLRKLSQKHNLPVVDSIDTMNQALRQKGVYPQSTWRSISAWYDLRTDAAHGKERDYAHQEVQLMISGVRDLVNRYPS